MTTHSPKFYVNRIAAVLACFVALTWLATPVLAGAWSRATGEARVMQTATKDLRNRLERLYRGSPAASYSVYSDEIARGLIELTREQTPAVAIESELNRFLLAFENTRALVASDYHIAHDKNVNRYLDQIDDRFENLVKDLRRADPPVVSYSPITVVQPSLGGVRDDGCRDTTFDHHENRLRSSGFGFAPQLGNLESDSYHGPLQAENAYRGSKLPYGMQHNPNGFSDGWYESNGGLRQSNRTPATGNLPRISL